MTPTKFTTRRRTGFLEALQRGMTIRGAAAVCGIGRSTVYRTISEDPDFEEAMEIAQGNAQVMLLEKVFAAIENAPDGWKAATWMLERRWPDEFGAKQHVEVSGNPDRPAVAVEIGMTLDQRTSQVVTILTQLGRLPPEIARVLEQLLPPKEDDE